LILSPTDLTASQVIVLDSWSMVACYSRVIRQFSARPVRQQFICKCQRAAITVGDGSRRYPSRGVMHRLDRRQLPQPKQRATDHCNRTSRRLPATVASTGLFFGAGQIWNSLPQRMTSSSLERQL